MNSDLSHFDEAGNSRMVDISAKPHTQRMARAGCRVTMSRETLQRIREGGLAKGDVLGVARLAGIMAAKKTDELIPLCHSLSLTRVEIHFEFPTDSAIDIESIVENVGPTGVEMEALVAATTSALTVYDMCKSIDRAMTVDKVRLLEKSGGRSGHFQRDEETREEKTE